MVASDEVVEVDERRPARPSARLDLTRLYEDDQILVVNKPAGLLAVATSPEARASEDTVLRRAQDYARHLRGRNGYAGMLHRLDRDTSGALAIALSRPAHARGRELFKVHAFERWYLALVDGVPRVSEGTIEAAISNTYEGGRRRVVSMEDLGRPAVTHYRVLERYRHAALLELQLETGRQHQIRLHLQQLGHPLLGERVYADEGERRGARRQMLHAWRLAFPHPLRDLQVRAEAPLPEDFETRRAQLSRGTHRH